MGLPVEKNNRGIVTEPDFVMKKAKNSSPRFIDFQYSNNFNKYGDIRLDVISAYTLKPVTKDLLGNKKPQTEARDFNKELLSHIKDYISKNPLSSMSFLDAIDRWLTISKPGKIYKKTSRIDTIVWFMFDNDMGGTWGGAPDAFEASTVPYLAYAAPTTGLESFIESSWPALVLENRFKLNDKTGLGDKHGSAFFAVKLEKLLEAGIGTVLQTRSFSMVVAGEEPRTFSR